MSRTILTIDEVSTQYKIPVNTLRHWRNRGQGEGPVSFRLGRRVVYYESDVIAWIDEQHRIGQQARQAESA